MARQLENTRTLNDLLAGVTLDAKKSYPFQIFDILRELIVSVRLQPGQRISEKEIGAALNASKTPVREALIRLESVRLVKIVPQSGSYVTRISLERYRTACFIRLQLELGAARGAAIAPDPQYGVERLEECLARQSEAFLAQDLETFFTQDEDFHRQIFVMAGVADVWNTAYRSQFDVNRARQIRKVYGIFDGPKILAEHRAIIDALRQCDPQRAEAAVRIHIGDLDRQVGELFQDERLFRFVDIPEAA